MLLVVYQGDSVKPALKFRKIFALEDAPRDWHLVNISLDWSGDPLILMAEGRPPKPDQSSEPDAWAKWFYTPPKAHHAIYGAYGKQQSIRFDASEQPTTFHLQPYESGFLVAESRGLSRIYDIAGNVKSSANLGNASEDIQTTPSGKIWVSYFDEGVFGGGIGRDGLVCFDTKGEPVFRYAEFAERNKLPMICDCYAMNVEMDGSVWLNYYMDFPLVHLRNFELERAWLELGCLGSAFAREESNTLVHVRGTHFLRTSLELRGEPEELSVVDERGVPIIARENQRAIVAARGGSLIFCAEDGVYELISA